MIGYKHWKGANISKDAHPIDRADYSIDLGGNAGFSTEIAPSCHTSSLPFLL